MRCLVVISCLIDYCMYICNIFFFVYLVKIIVFFIKVIYLVYMGNLFGNLGVFFCIDVYFNLIK